MQNAYLLSKIGADTAENEQHFAEILPTDALWRRRHGPPGEPVAGRVRPRRVAGRQPAAGHVPPGCGFESVDKCRYFYSHFDVAEGQSIKIS